MLIAFKQLTLPGEVPISGALSVFSAPIVALKANELVNYLEFYLFSYFSELLQHYDTYLCKFLEGGHSP